MPGRWRRNIVPGFFIFADNAKGLNQLPDALVIAPGVPLVGQQQMVILALDGTVGLGAGNHALRKGHLPT